VVFHPLGREHIRKIARIQMRGLTARLAERDLKLDISEAALDLLGNAGFDPVYGARPLERAIHQQLGNPLAQRILAGELKPGDTIRIHAEGGRLAFSRG
jgi:ATP-dependent Clp protease ATP-binding subunit ClpB